MLIRKIQIYLTEIPKFLENEVKITPLKLLRHEVFTNMCQHVIIIIHNNQ